MGARIDHSDPCSLRAGAGIAADAVALVAGDHVTLRIELPDAREPCAKSAQGEL
jgi:hypothetical protein